jgi:hypothetical protein
MRLRLSKLAYDDLDSIYAYIPRFQAALRDAITYG